MTLPVVFPQLAEDELNEAAAYYAGTRCDSREYAEVVRLNDTLSLRKLQAEELWTVRAAS